MRPPLFFASYQKLNIRTCWGYPLFVARIRLMTQDAILLTTAIKHDMDYFVSMDKDFHDLLGVKRTEEEQESSLRGGISKL